jgi:hypothetical protein
MRRGTARTGGEVGDRGYRNGGNLRSAIITSVAFGEAPHDRRMAEAANVVTRGTREGQPSEGHQEFRQPSAEMFQVPDWRLLTYEDTLVGNTFILPDVRVAGAVYRGKAECLAGMATKTLVWSTVLLPLVQFWGRSS